MAPAPLAAVSVGATKVDPWTWHAHPDTWLVIGLAAFGYWYAVTRIGPRSVGRGAAAASRRQVMWFVAGLVILEIASDWPVHDLAENYLFSAHMVEHMLISLVAPPMLLLGVPGWLTRRILRPRWAGGSVRVLCRPLVAAVLFNTFVAVSHAPFWVNGTLEHHALHFWAHLLLFTVSMIMWFPVVNRLPDYPTLSSPMKMVYLFFQSIIPNVPAAFLILASGVVYRFYLTVPHPLPGLGAVNDQQLAGAIMKVGGTFYLWGIIVVVFFRWVSAEYRSANGAHDRAASAAEGVASLAARNGGLAGLAQSSGLPDVLTWDRVAEELARSQPAQPGS